MPGNFTIYTENYADEAKSTENNLGLTEEVIPQPQKPRPPKPKEDLAILPPQDTEIENTDRSDEDDDEDLFDEFGTQWEQRQYGTLNGPYRIYHRAAGKFELTRKSKSLGFHRTEHDAKLAAVEDFKNSKAETPPKGAKFSLWLARDRLSYHHTYDEAREAAIDHAKKQGKRSSVLRFQKDSDNGVFQCGSYRIGPAAFVPAPRLHKEWVTTATQVVLQPHRLAIVNMTERDKDAQENEDSIYLAPEGKNLLELTLEGMKPADLARLVELGTTLLAGSQPTKAPNIADAQAVSLAEVLPIVGQDLGNQPAESEQGQEQPGRIGLLSTIPQPADPKAHDAKITTTDNSDSSHQGRSQTQATLVTTAFPCFIVEKSSDDVGNPWRISLGKYQTEQEAEAVARKHQNTIQKLQATVQPIVKNTGEGTATCVTFHGCHNIQIDSNSLQCIDELGQTVILIGDLLQDGLGANGNLGSTSPKKPKGEQTEKKLQAKKRRTKSEPID